MDIADAITQAKRNHNAGVTYDIIVVDTVSQFYINAMYPHLVLYEDDARILKMLPSLGWRSFRSPN